MSLGKGFGRLLTAGLSGLGIAVASASPAGAQTAPVQSSFGRYSAVPRFSESVVTSQYITMRDGVRIAVSVARPAVNGKAVDGKFPVIWNGSLDIGGPNADGGPIKVQGGRYGMSSIVGHGYVLVTAARRGSGASFGTRRGYQDRTEAYDSYEITEWAARQPWSTGKVGMFGCSNTGEAVLHAMTVLPPSMRAVFTGCFSWNKFDGFTRGGMIANWGTGPTRTIEEDMRSTPVDGDESKSLLRQAATEHQGSTNLFELMVGMPFRDSVSPLTLTRFWAEGSASSYAPQLATSSIAVYIQGGWQDDFRREGLVAMANLPNRPKVVIGNWTHCSTAGYDDEIAMEALRFFDRYLKDVDTGIDRDDPVHYYTVNAPAGTEWRSAPTWPIPGTRNDTLYLSAGRKGPALAKKAGKGPGGIQFTARQEGECPGAGGARAQPCHIPGLGPSFALAPFESDVEVTGHPLVDLWLTSTASDEHVFAYLEDVAPDGTVTVVTEGRLKASFRKRHAAPWNLLGLPWHRSYKEDAEPLTPGEPARLQFDMLPASYVFRKGHRLQVTVTAWDWRERGAIRRDTPSTIRILDDSRHRSTVRLPIAPPNPKIALRQS